MSSKSLITALKKRFRSPAEALHALGLDPSILNVDIIAGDSKSKALSRDQEFESDRERDDKLDQEFARMLQAHPDILTVVQKFLGRVLTDGEMTKFNQAIENLPEAEQGEEPDADQIKDPNDPDQVGSLDASESFEGMPLPGGGMVKGGKPAGTERQLAGAKSANAPNGAADARQASRRLAGNIGIAFTGTTSAEVAAAAHARRKANPGKKPIAADASAKSGPSDFAQSITKHVGIAW